ncbi:hypothetical protein HSX11_16140 [Oxalobacteraceae bacterium]|nr:hypothetical protein [Oxalobacteraceae bacterium]
MHRLIPLSMATANTDLPVGHEALRLRAHDVQAKPVNFTEFNASAGNVPAPRTE